MRPSLRELWCCPSFLRRSRQHWPESALMLGAYTELLMTPALQNLDPKEVWKHFDALAAIPRPSTKEAAAREYVLALAKRLGLEAVHDEVGYTVIRTHVHAGRERALKELVPW